MKIEDCYINSSYLNENPSRVRQEAPWKADTVQGLLYENKINPTSICNIGCGSGDILINLTKYYPVRLIRIGGVRLLGGETLILLTNR